MTGSKSRYTAADVEKMRAAVKKGATFVSLGVIWGTTPSYVGAMCKGQKGPSRIVKQHQTTKGAKGRAEFNREKILNLVAEGFEDAEIALKLGLSKSYTSSLRRKLPKKEKRLPNDDGWHGYKEPNWDHDVSKRCLAVWSAENLKVRVDVV